MIVYIDTEFTDLYADNGPIRLISAAFVAENDEEFYFELTDGYQEIDCSEFVLANVLPHLNHIKYGHTAARAAIKLKNWCESLTGPIQFASDAPRYDIELLSELLNVHKLFIVNLDTNGIIVDANEIDSGVKTYFRYNPMAIPHHALWDARALAYGCKMLAS